MHADWMLSASRILEVGLGGWGLNRATGRSPRSKRMRQKATTSSISEQRASAARLTSIRYDARYHALGVRTSAIGPAQTLKLASAFVR